MKRGLNILKEYGCVGPGAARGPGTDLREGELNHLGEEDATLWSADLQEGNVSKRKDKYSSSRAKVRMVYLQQRACTSCVTQH